MAFMTRLEKGAAANFVTLNARESELYPGAGWTLAAVENDEIVDVMAIDHGMKKDELEACFSPNPDLTAQGRRIQAWSHGREVYLGMMSCYEFCSPERYDQRLLAKIANLIVEQVVG